MANPRFEPASPESSREPSFGDAKALARPVPEIYEFRDGKYQCEIDLPLKEVVDAFHRTGSGGLQLYLWRLINYTPIRQEKFIARSQNRDPDFDQFGLQLGDKLSEDHGDGIDDQLEENSAIEGVVAHINRSMGDFDLVIERREECIQIFGRRAIEALDRQLGVDLTGLAEGDDSCVLGVSVDRIRNAFNYYISCDYWKKHPGEIDRTLFRAIVDGGLKYGTPAYDRAFKAGVDRIFEAFEGQSARKAG